MKSNKQKIVKSILDRLSAKYEGSNFRYEYRPYNDTHIVEVYPLSLYDNLQYSEEELDIILKFEEKYGETLLFVSEKSLTKVTNPIYQVAYKEKIETNSFYSQMFELSRPQAYENSVCFQ